MNWSEPKTPATKIIRSTQTYVVQRIIQDLLFIRRNLSGMNSSRKSFSISNPTPITVNGRLGTLSIYMASGNVGSNIRDIIEPASASDGIRKKIREKQTNRNVMIIFIDFPTHPYSHLCCPVIFSTTRQKPCMQPQTMYVQLAPCQIPLTKKVRKIFL